MMRYRFVDEILALDLGARPSLEARVTFAPDHDALSGPQGAERIPPSLLLEVMAMTGGHLLTRRFPDRRLPVLLKVRECRFLRAARPGRALDTRAVLGDVSATEPALAEVTAEMRDADGPVAAGRILYVCVPVSADALAAVR